MGGGGDGGCGRFWGRARPLGVYSRIHGYTQPHNNDTITKTGGCCVRRRVGIYGVLKDGLHVLHRTCIVPLVLRRCEPVNPILFYILNYNNKYATGP